MRNLTQNEITEAKQHLYLALGQFEPLPKTHEELVEKMREYFSDQKVAVFSKMVARMGEGNFRDFIAETVVESGMYYRDEEGQVRVR